MNHLRTIRDTVICYAEFCYMWLLACVGNPSKQIDQEGVLLLAWLFPPKISGGVYRPVSLVRYGKERNWRVNVISGAYHGDPTEAGNYLLKSLPEQVEVLRVEQSTREPSYRFFPRIDGGFAHIARTFFLARIKYRNSPPSIVMGTGPVFHNFVAAYFLAKFFRAKLVLEYRDEWTESPFDFIDVGNVDKYWEEKCLSKADLVIFTTESQLEHQLGVFKKLVREKCKVVPNGWEPDDFESNGQAEKEANGGVTRISFVGNLGDHTPPDSFLLFMEQFFEKYEDYKDRIELVFIGQKSQKALNAVNRFKHRENIKLIDQVSKKEAAKYMKDSQALLLFSTVALRRYLPGKLYDYLASKRPILCFGEEGEISRLIKQLEAGYFINDADSLREALELIGGKSSSQCTQKLEQWLAGHTRKEMADRTLNLFESICAPVSVVKGSH
ncbi:MAG: glycosyltransferase [Gammaproteobacteria bacterium]